MADPFTIVVAGYIAKNVPQWLEDLHSNLLAKSKELAVAKGKEWLSEKDQQRRLQQVLKKAVKRGLTKFRTLQERDQYKNILSNLFEPGEHSSTMRREAMKLFSLSEVSNIEELNETYNRSFRSRNLSQVVPPASVDAAPYLISFFDALIIELYADSFFKDQISDVIQTRAAMIMPQYISETNIALHKIHETIKDSYKEEQFQRDVKLYTEFMERTLRNLKIIGFASKDLNRDPELGSIFVPLRIALSDDAIAEDKLQHSLVPLLKQYSYMVLLGEPGSGKSTIARYLSWSHAKANLEQTDLSNISFLPSCPLPLRIELRLLMQDRKQHPNYGFLTYVTKVLLERENININLSMFEKLLMQKRMLVLFDGLDEVTTLDERQRLVQEIEHFTRLYSGNYVLITTRPVGYELASCSKQMFVHARVQNFNDEQIHQFLERWYNYVLGLLPLPYQEQQELETLFNTLKENKRLHRLAENPLLLTVITGLYRSQRLPEKRVQVYDKCAELLLETWATLKGTNVRWANMKMGKEDQFACIAHLGFQLHKRSQEEKGTQKISSSATETTATDVPARLILREIESFLSNGRLIGEVAEQHKEAKFFLNLMREEAGLIVERGTDESGENIYGFVHRTFQEYFAASDVYERYKDNEDPSIITDFLEEHLHDPHWHEVILLLLGKLGRRPVTVRLRQILDGKIKSRRGYYNSIVQQDLFFVCDCLIEEMAVENDLAESVVMSLGNLVTSSPFEGQRVTALEILSKLMQTKQFVILAQRELKRLMMLEAIIDIALRIRAGSSIFRHSVVGSEERTQATQILLGLIQRSDLTIKQIIQAAQVFYQYGSVGSEERARTTQILLGLIQRSDLTIEQTTEVVLVFYQYGEVDSEEQAQVIQILLGLAQRSDLTIEQIIQAASLANVLSRVNTMEKRQGYNILFGFVQRSDLTIEQNIMVVQSLCSGPFNDQEEKQQAIQILLGLAQRSDLTVEQTIQVAEALYRRNPEDSLEEQQASQILLGLVQRSDLTVEQTIQVAEALYRRNPEDSLEEQQAIQKLLGLVQRSDLTVGQTIQAAKALYRCTLIDSSERELSIQVLARLEEHESITLDQRLDVISMPLLEWSASYLDKARSVRKLLTLPLSEKVWSYFRGEWRCRSHNILPEEIPYIVEIINQDILSLNIRNEMYSLLRSVVPQFHEISFEELNESHP